MSELRTRHLLDSMALYCIGVDYLDQTEALPRHSADIVFSDMTELGGRR